MRSIGSPASCKVTPDWNSASFSPKASKAISCGGNAASKLFF